MNISIYKDINSKKPENLSVRQCLKRIQAGKSKIQVEKIREADAAGRDASTLKKKLPSVCFSGIFDGQRKDENLIQHSGFIVLDFDKVNDLRDFQNELISYPFIYACWVSPSGNGLKALVKISDPKKHAEHYDALKDLFPGLDGSGRNVARVCFESYDPDIYINESAEIFTTIKEHLVEVVYGENVSDSEVFKHLEKWMNKKGEFFGKGSRNNYVFKIASAACRFGVPEDAAMSAVLTSYPPETDFPESEVRTTVKSAYKKNRDREGSAKFSNDRFVYKDSNREVVVHVNDNHEIKSRIDATENDMSFLATPDDYDDYLYRVRTNSLQMGLTTGMENTDKHFLFKQGNLVITNGLDNVGKTKFVLFLNFLAALLHDWRFGLYVGENTIGSVMRTLIEYYTGKKLDRCTESEYKEAKDFVEKHFLIVRSEESLFNYRDMINMGKKLKDQKDIHAFLVDPYNALKIELTNASKLSTHEYHYEALSEMKMYGTKEKVGYWLNMHPVTNAIRQKDADGYPAPPGKEDTEGGGKSAFKADEFMTVHRRTQHPTEWMITDVYVRKVKEWETGGKPTPIIQPLRFKMNPSGVGFSELNEMQTLFDPVADFMKRSGRRYGPQPDFTRKENIWKPYKDEDGGSVGF